MPTQKRTFSSFAEGSNSTYSSRNFSSFSNKVDYEDNNLWYSDSVCYVDEGASRSISIPFLSLNDTENDLALISANETIDGVFEEPFQWHDEDETASDPCTFYNSSSQSTAHSWSSSASSHVSARSRSIEPKNVCYGMEVMHELAGMKEGILKSHYLLDVVWYDRELFLALPSGLKAALLNQQIGEALQGPVERGEVRLEALLHKETFQHDITSATTLKNSETTANINVYGSCDIVQTIGNCLSQHKIWLQRPDWRPIECTYDNPHVIHFNSIKSTDDDIAIKSTDTLLNEPLTIHVEGVYAQLSRASHLHGVAGDSRLTTQLLPHQEEALDFMMQREQGNIPEEFRLWQRDAVGEDFHYRHKITEQKSRTAPDEQGGGILADEMGTGKTLSTLALIIATLEAAEAWAHDAEVHLSQNIPAFKTLSQATLVVVPSPLLLGAWQKEMRKHTKMALKVFVYHGMDRSVDCAHLAKHDVVLTTYHTLVSDHGRNVELITQIAWYRIVLDEAHFIRRPSTSLHKRVAELDAKFRWCLTGTPIQNSLDDIGALFAFLSITPFDRLGYFRRHISSKYAEGPHGLALAQRNLIQLLDAMCIRRTKDQINLRPANEAIRYVKLSSEERRQYDSVKEDMKRAMSNIVGESDSRQRFGSFQAKLQLRLLCNHGTYQNHFHWAKNGHLLDNHVEGFDRVAPDGHTTCNVCGSSDSMFLLEEDLMYASNCVHILCSTCKKKSFDQCPLCDYITRSHNNAGRHTGQEPWTRRDLRLDGHSSKMGALVHDLLACREDKSIVFSGWTTTLDLVARYLENAGIPFDRIDGEQSFSHRHKVLDAFSADESFSVLIMTTGVGAFGLDLIVANRVFLIEPQWNPSIESQAVGRTTRIGQHKTVEVVRYITRDTVEEELQDLQRRKRGMARMAEKDRTDGEVKAEAWE